MKLKNITLHQLQLGFLLVNIGLGFLLRVNVAIHNAFWIDETSIFTVAIRNSFLKLAFLQHWDSCHPQLFYTFLHFWQQISTDTLFLRIPSLMAFFPSAAFVYLIGKSMAGKISGFLSLLLFAVNPFFVNLGFQQKPYAFVMMFLFGSLFFLIRSIEDRRLRFKALFIAFSVLAFYSDYSFVWYWLSLTVVGLAGLAVKSLKLRQLVKSIFKPYVIASIIMALQTPIFLSGLSRALDLASYLSPPKLVDVQWTVALFGGLLFYDSYLMWIFIGIALASLVVMFKEKNVSKIFFLLLIQVVFYVPLLLSYTISQSNPIFLHRNIWVCSLYFLFLVPYVATRIPNRIFRDILVILVCIQIAHIAPASFIHDEGFDGSDPFVEVHNLSKNIQGTITIVLMSDGDFKLSSIHDYYYKGFYDGHKITDYQVIWIKKANLFGWKLDDTYSLPENVIFLTDAEISPEERAGLIDVYAQLCKHAKMCYGPYLL